MSLVLVNAAGQQTLVLQGRHVRWVNDGRAFLAHVGDLAALKLQPQCRQCLAAALAHTCVVGEPQDDPPRVAVRCGHRAGTVRLDQPLDATLLLGALGWTLTCVDCGSVVTGDNHQAATRLTIDCPCTTRVYQMAVG